MNISKDFDYAVNDITGTEFNIALISLPIAECKSIYFSPVKNTALNNFEATLLNFVFSLETDVIDIGMLKSIPVGLNFNKSQIKSYIKNLVKRKLLSINGNKIRVSGVSDLIALARKM